MSQNRIFNCLNCGNEIDLDKKYCSRCGQKTKAPKLTVWVIVQDFLNRVFDLDSKFFRTFLHVFIPGKLTKAYIAGKRETYYNPIRILFISMLVHFAILGYIVTKELGDSVSTEPTKRRTYQMDFATKIDSLAPTYLNTKGQEDLDSLLTNLYRENFKNGDKYFLANSNFFTLDFNKLKITKSDILMLSESEVIEKYGITEWYNKHMLRQLAKIYKNTKGLPAFLIGNSIWTTLIVLLFIALIMKIIYIRKFYFYAEHLVLLIHIHSTCFIIASVILVISFLSGDRFSDLRSGNLAMNSVSATVSLVLSSLFMYISFIAYYKQGYIKTALKLFVITMAYIIVLTFAAISVSLLSLVFF